MRKRMIVTGLTCAILSSAAAWGYAQREPAKKMLSAQDYTDIMQLYAADAHASDMGGPGDGSDFVANFTPDGAFGNNKGPDALRKMIKNYHERLKKEGYSSRHTYHSLTFTPTADGAKGVAYVLIFNASAKPPFLDRGGVYDDTLVKTPQGWKFKQRNLKREFEPSMP